MNIKNLYRRLLLSPYALRSAHPHMIQRFDFTTTDVGDDAVGHHHTDWPPSPPRVGPPRLSSVIWLGAVADSTLVSASASLPTTDQPQAGCRCHPLPCAGPRSASIPRPRVNRRWQPSLAAASPEGVFFLIWLNLSLNRFECSFEFRLFRFELWIVLRLFRFELQIQT
jgi:hypothetical protein